NLFFTTLEPEFLPKPTTSNFSTGLPFPFGNIKCDINIAQPGNLKVSDPVAKLVSLTCSGNASLTLEDNTTKYSYALSLTPFYTVVLKDSKVFLKFNSIDVNIKGNGISDPTAAGTI